MRVASQRFAMYNKCTTSEVKVNIMLFKTSENGTHIWIEWKWILNRANEWISIYTGDKRFNKKLADRWKMDSAIHSSHKMACIVLSLCVCMCFSVVSSSLIHYYVYSIKAWSTCDTYWYLCKDCCAAAAATAVVVVCSCCRCWGLCLCAFEISIRFKNTKWESGNESINNGMWFTKQLEYSSWNSMSSFLCSNITRSNNNNYNYYYFTSAHRFSPAQYLAQYIWWASSSQIFVKNVEQGCIADKHEYSKNPITHWWTIIVG